MNKPLLEIKDLSVNFKTEKATTSAVKNVSFTVKKGAVTAVVGESGSGKTLTSLSVLNLLPAGATIQGNIFFSADGYTQIDLLHTSVQQLRKIRGNQVSMIFQEPMTSLNPVLTCGKQVMESILLHQKKTGTEAKKDTVELFKKVELPEPEIIFSKYPHQLSGGQKQRVMIAMAMSCNPALLIADEPTTALDVTVQKTILKLIKTLQQDNNMGVIYISHDLNLVAEIADKVIVMYRGSVIESGSVKDIFTQPQHPYTKALLACRPSAHSKGFRLPQVSDFMVEKSENTPEKKICKEPEADATDVILKVKDLTVSFPVKKNIWGKPSQIINAVDNISFEVFAGETLGIVGESGSGKTTLGRSLLRLIEPSSGKIIYRNRDIAQIADEEFRSMRKHMQIIFQDPYGSLNPRISIGDAIGEPLIVHSTLSEKQRKEKVYELLEKVDLKPEYFNRYPHQFSGGQRQRISIARALGLQPDLIICDESVSALDVSIQAQILNLLNDLKKESNFTCIFISHDLEVVRYLSDRIIVMNKGSIEESGTADEIYFHPQKDYTQKLIASIPQGYRS